MRVELQNINIIFSHAKLLYNSAECVKLRFLLVNSKLTEQELLKIYSSLFAH